MKTIQQQATYVDEYMDAISQPQATGSNDPPQEASYQPQEVNKHSKTTQQSHIVCSLHTVKLFCFVLRMHVLLVSVWVYSYSGDDILFSYP